MGFPLRFTLRLASAAILAAAPGAHFAAAQTTPYPCPGAAPVLTGPALVQAGDAYAVSWTNVLGNLVSANTAYAYSLVRALDADFTKVTDSITTQRSALTLPAPPAGATTLYHRIVVSTPCPTFAAVVSNVLAVPVKTTCDVPPSVGLLSASPENPPAFSTWVVSWSTLGTGPGPGVGVANLKFRIRRTSALEPEGREWVVDGGAASFAGPPGDYVFEVRAEASCGSVGPWSPPKKVTVGTLARPSLVLVSEPAPLARLVSATGLKAGTSFTVRNGGTEPVTATTQCADSGFAIAPSTFTLPPGATQEISVTSLYVTALAQPVKSAVTVASGSATLSVPIALVLSAAPAAAPVAWSQPTADIDVNGTSVTRSLVNTGPTPAAFVGTAKAPWLAVQSPDGQPWDRPLAPFETRPVQLVVDRAKRRGETGTEVGATRVAWRTTSSSRGLLPTIW